MEVVQVLPRDNYDIFVYFVDGKIKKYNVSHLVGKGIFEKLLDLDFYTNNCTVLNGTLAWTLDGKYDKSNCIDIDPFTIYEKGIDTEDPLSLIAEFYFYTCSAKQKLIATSISICTIMRATIRLSMWIRMEGKIRLC